MALAVCLLCDRRSERAVRAVWDRIEEQGVASLRSHTHGRHVPHVSYAVLPHCSLAPRATLAQLPVVVAAVFDVLPLQARLDRAALVNSATGEVTSLRALP